MAGEGYGTTGIGTGLAQVIDNAKPYTAQIGKAYVDKAAADEKKKLEAAKTTRGLLKDLPKGTSLTYSPYLNQKRQDIYNFALENINNPSKQLELTQRINDFGADLAMSKENDKLLTQRMAKVAEGGQYHNIENLDKYNTPRDFSKILTKEDAFKMFADDNRLLNDIVKDTYDYKDHSDYIGKQLGDYAQHNRKQMDDGLWGYDISQDTLEGAIKASFANKFDNYRHYLKAYQNDPELSAKYKGDDAQTMLSGAVAAAVKDFGPTQIGKFRIRPAKDSNFVFNIGGEDGNKVTENVVTEQVRPIGLGGRNVKVRVFLYEKPVDLGARTQAERMFKIDTAGNTVPVEADAPPVSYNETIEAPVSTVDVEWTGKDGQKRTVKKGQIVDPDDAKSYAEFFTGKQIPTENALLSFGFDKDNNKYYEPAERIAPASIASFYGAKGATAKSEYIKKGVEKIAGATGGTKTVKVQQSRNFK